MKPNLLLNDERDTYFNMIKCLSYNLFWNELVGGRGVGKTTRLIIYCMNNFIRKGEQFLFMRRYKNEMKEVISKRTFESIYDGIYIKGSGSGESYMVMNEDVVCGHLLTLAAQQKYKSSDFSRVTTIVFDEAFLERGKVYYIPDEVTNFLQLVSTVQRTRTNLKVFILSNNNSVFNPYHTYFKIPDFQYIYTDKERGIYCEKIPVNPKLLEKEKVTPLYRLTAGTEYGEYHYANQVLRRISVESYERPKSMAFFIMLVANNEYLTVYRINNTKYEEWYIANEKGTNKELYTYIILDHDLVQPYYARMFKSKFLGMIDKMLGLNRIHFQNGKCYDVLQIILDVVR